MAGVYVYILKCADDSLYTGVTNDVPRRVYEHQEGLIPRCYTHTRRPVTLVYTEYGERPIEGIQREKQIKRWTRVKKQALIDNDEERLVYLAKSTVKKRQIDSE